MTEKRKEMKKLQRSVENTLLEKERERDEEGRIIVSMNVLNDDSFLSPFSETETPMISSGVAEFIEESIDGIAPYETYTLRIKSNCIDEQEKEVYKKAVKAYFQRRYTQNEKEIRRNRIISALCLFFGILVLGFAIFLEYHLNLIWAEVMDIVAWVLVWEAVYVEAFENYRARGRRYYYLACMTMKIEYITE